MDQNRSTPASSRSRISPERPDEPYPSGECKLIDSILTREPEVLALDDEELAMIFAHQMNTRLDFDLGSKVLPLLPLVNSSDSQRLGEANSHPLATFGDLRTHPNPPLELLERAKRFAKDHRTGRLRGLPKEVATALYYVSLVVAELRCQHSISTLSRDELLQGIRWLLSQSWLDQQTRELFLQAQNQLGKAPDSISQSKLRPPNQDEVAL